MTAKKIAICIPCRDSVPVQFFNNFLGILTSYAGKHNLGLSISTKFPIDAARNELI